MVLVGLLILSKQNHLTASGESPILCALCHLVLYYTTTAHFTSAHLSAHLTLRTSLCALLSAHVSLRTSHCAPHTAHLTLAHLTLRTSLCAFHSAHLKSCQPSHSS